MYDVKREEGISGGYFYNYVDMFSHKCLCS